MLRYLQVRNFAVVAELELEFSRGMTVLTGETGAGKSILIEALGLALGDRADAGMVRTGTDQAAVTAVFAVPGDDRLTAMLDQHGIGAEDELILKRQFNIEGRSRAFVNGTPVPNQMLRTLGELLVDIHGQHDHHSLLRRDAQRELLDEYANHPLRLQAVAAACARVRGIDAELDNLAGAGANAERERDLLRFQVDELQALKLTPEGLHSLGEEHRRLTHITVLAEGCRQLLEALSEDDASAQAVIDKAQSQLQGLCRYDEKLNATADLLLSASVQLSEVGHALNAYLDKLDADPERIRRIDEQLAALHDLARKHRVRIEELPGQLEMLEQALLHLESGAQRRQELDGARAAAVEEYRRAAGALHQSRTEAAKRLVRAVTDNMHQLGMPGGEFSVSIERADSNELPVHGSDRIEFLVSANPGQPLRPLTKVASGGELSRISLAIQVITAKGRGVLSLVFDEVDVGIGGRVAEIVGRQLRELGENRQVLCITHLPQVAALGHEHLQVTKTISAGETRIAVRRLNGDDRVAEVARMLGGITITVQTVEHARAMLKQAQRQGGGP